LPVLIRDSTITFQKDRRITSTCRSASQTRQPSEHDPPQSEDERSADGPDGQNPLVRTELLCLVRGLVTVARFATRAPWTSFTPKPDIHTSGVFRPNNPVAVENSFEECGTALTASWNRRPDRLFRLLRKSPARSPLEQIVAFAKWIAAGRELAQTGWLTAADGRVPFHPGVWHMPANAYRAIVSAGSGIA
jgi:hypothetical protein